MCSEQERVKRLNRAAARHELDGQSVGFIEYGRVNKSFFATTWSVLRYIPDWIYARSRGLIHRVLLRSRRRRTQRSGEGMNKRLGVILFLGSSLAVAQSTTLTGLQAQAKVAEADARTTALARVPGGTVASSELERERGKLIWAFDIARPGTQDVREVQVDATTGKIVSQKIEAADKPSRQAAVAKH